MSSDFFPDRLRELREAAALSQKAVAERVGITVRQVSRLETGAQVPTWPTVVKLAEALGVNCLAFLEAPVERPAPGRGRPTKAREEAAKAPGAKQRGRARKAR
jgi:transcriptional regulator with XRE-family HTH domain